MSRKPEDDQFMYSLERPISQLCDKTESDTGGARMEGYGVRSAECGGVYLGTAGPRVAIIIV